MLSVISQASKSVYDANITSYDKKYKMLSNLAERNFTYDNKKYRSVEHAYQTLKSGKFDENIYTKYLQADFRNGMGPKLVGRMGTYRPVTDGLMKNLIKESLAQNPDKLQLLLKTGNEKLTHTIGNDYWTNRFPEILTELRDEQISATPKTKTPTSKNTLKIYYPYANKNKTINHANSYKQIVEAQNPGLTVELVDNKSQSDMVFGRGQGMGNPFSSESSHKEVIVKTRYFDETMIMYEAWLKGEPMPEGTVPITPEQQKRLNALKAEWDNKLKPFKSSSSFETVKRYSVEDLRNNPDKIYIFGDNTEGWGKGGQAIVRDESNAFGISTKDSPTQFMSDNNFEANKAKIDADIAAIKADGRPIVFPEDGIGTGRADLKNKAPKTWNYLEEQINELRGKTSNNAGEIKFNQVDPNPRYPERTKYNAVNSDITYDFAKGAVGSGATKKHAGNKYNWVGINDDGVMTKPKKPLAEAIAKDLLDGKTVNIAGHGIYKSTRRGSVGFTRPMTQSVIDNEMVELFQIVDEITGDNPITGKVISGGQSGFDKAGVQAAHLFGIPTEVNYSGKGLWRDSTGKDIDNFDSFKKRFDTFGPRSVGAAQVNNLEGQVDNISKKYNLPKGTTKKFLSSFANNVLDPMESIIVKSLTAVGLGALAGPLVTYEISNILLNMFQKGEQSAAKIQLANSAIFGEALGLIEDSSEYTEGLEFEIIIDALEGVVNFSEMSPVMYAEDKALQVPVIRKGVDTVMKPVSKVYDTSKDYLKTGGQHLIDAASRIGRTITE
jgi:predicted NAD-dependent protein-ADP-ribosyltransferase YbiA (DUF1768 family)